MRVVQNQQMILGEVDIAQIEFDPRSRDDIPKVLRGLQHLYMNQALRQQIFALLEAEIAPPRQQEAGAPWHAAVEHPGLRRTST